MIITLSPTFMAERAYPEDWIKGVANNLGTYFRPKWANERSVRGVLVKAQGSYQAAADEEHDAFIGGIFRLDPEAYVRTALAVYNTKAEFDARLPFVKSPSIVKAMPSKA